MPIDRSFWLSSFQKDKFPYWHCPRCYTGTLKPIENSFQYGETGDTNEELINSGGYLRHAAYEFHYSVLLRCDNSNCGEHVASAGNGYRQEYQIVEDGKLIFDEGGNPETEFIELFYPEFFYPPIPIFYVHPRCPKKIEKEIRASSNLFFTDPSASANCVRKAIEEILTERGVKRYTLSKKGKRVKIQLHDRIVEFEKTKPEVAKKLFAIKWLGNEGSHSGTMTKNDLLDAYEILEIIFDDLYVGYRKSVEKKVLQINKRKKPLHPST